MKKKNAFLKMLPVFVVCSAVLFGSVLQYVVNSDPRVANYFNTQRHKEFNSSTYQVRVFNDETHSRLGHPINSGSCFLTNDKDGNTYVWTNAHVVHQVKEDNMESNNFATLNMPYVDGDDMYLSKSYPLELLSYSNFTAKDVAVLVVKDKKNVGHPSKFTNINYSPGTRIYLSGYQTPYDGCCTTEGYISRLDVFRMHGRFDAMNISVGYGMSGGPIRLSNGDVIGMVSRALNGEFSEVHALFVPFREIKKWANEEGLLFAMDPNDTSSLEEFKKAKQTKNKKKTIKASFEIQIMFQNLYDLTERID